MALKSEIKNLTTSQQNLTPTIGVGQEGSLHSLTLGNGNTSTAVTTTLTFFDSSQSADSIFLIKSISANTTFVLDKPLNLEQGDIVKGSAAGTGIVSIASTFVSDSTAPIATGIDFQGAYTSTQTYSINQSVSYENSSYVSRINSNQNNQPDTSNSSWQLLAGQGETGSISANPTLVNPILSGDFTTSSGNFDIDPATQIVEVKGNGSDTEGQIKLNCHANSHGQTIKAQPHSEGVTNTSLLPKGASSTLVSEVGTASLSNKVFDIVSDTKGDVRDLQISQSSGATYTLTASDKGQMVRLNSAGIQALIPSSTFDAGDIVSVLNTTSTTGSITSQITMHVGGGASATGTAVLGINNIANIYFVSGGACIVTGGAT